MEMTEKEYNNLSSIANEIETIAIPAHLRA